ncbi:hypothetical protein [Marinomonas ostreistagni]|uniref:hypothetical protein n=1 Tax=Marinomonas ostreistagni TaxID=359209 RepID=UPI00195003F2|nr:hypothetical protein [Marinomonas ostreistagni]MBM6550025.1 hypothetical protein [Marinomonas ostreistagni]
MFLLYLFLALFCAALVVERVRLDPMLVVMPCVLLLFPTVPVLLTSYVNVLAVVLLMALFFVIKERQQLNVESITRLGAGLSLGGFVGVQLLTLLPLSQVTLVLLLLTLSSFSLGLSALKGVDILRLPQMAQLWAGLALGMVQFLGLGSGRALLKTHQEASSKANHFALWAFGLVGALIGLLALPSASTTPLHLDISVIVVALLAILAGLFLASRINVSAFESKLLRWIVVLVCLSVWAHLTFKFFIL